MTHLYNKDKEAQLTIQKLTRVYTKHYTEKLGIKKVTKNTKQSWHTQHIQYILMHPQLMNISDKMKNQILCNNQR